MKASKKILIESPDDPSRGMASYRGNGHGVRWYRQSG